MQIVCVITLFAPVYHWSSCGAKLTQDLNEPQQATGTQDMQPAPTSLTTTKTRKQGH